MGITGSCGKCALSLYKTSEQFSEVAVLLCIPTSSPESADRSASPATLGASGLLNVHHPSGCEEVCPYGFNLHSSKG